MDLNKDRFLDLMSISYDALESLDQHGHSDMKKVVRENVVFPIYELLLKLDKVDNCKGDELLKRCSELYNKLWL